MSDDPAFVFDPSTASVSLSTPRDKLPVYRQIPSSIASQPADLELSVSIELGRVRMRLADVLQLSDGAVLELDKVAGEPVDVVINEQIVARGEVVVMNDKFAIRITQVMPTAGQMQG